jgi:hypothetical protein
MYNNALPIAIIIYIVDPRSYGFLFFCWFLIEKFIQYNIMLDRRKEKKEKNLKDFQLLCMRCLHFNYTVNHPKISCFKALFFIFVCLTEPTIYHHVTQRR